MTSQDSPPAAEMAEFDIHSIAKTLLCLRIADYVFLIICAPYLVSQFLLGVIGAFAGSLSPLDLLAQGLLVLVLSAGVCLAFYSFGNISNRVIAAYGFATPPMILFLLFLVGSLVLLHIQAVPLGWADFFYPTAIAIGASFGLGAAIALRFLRLRPMNLRFRELLGILDRPKTAIHPKPPVINKRRGLLLGILGFALLLIPLSLFGVIGILLLMRARQYFQTSADQLLKLDKRKPILLLRSFEDEQDERKVRFNSWWNPVWIGYLLDYSIETRLSRHFTGFGPFIAIGSPQDAVPQIGAARINLADDLWQEAVVKWMESASVIVMFAGHTHWLSWELSKVVVGGHAEKLLLLFRKAPSLGGPFDDSEQRLQATRDAFSNTEWATALGKIDRSATLCAAAFHPGGSITVVRCPLHTHDTFHVGALIAHFQMLNAQREGKFGC